MEESTELLSTRLEFSRGMVGGELHMERSKDIGKCKFGALTATGKPKYISEQNIKQRILKLWPISPDLFNNAFPLSCYEDDRCSCSGIGCRGRSRFWEKKLSKIFCHA